MNPRAGTYGLGGALGRYAPTGRCGDAAPWQVHSGCTGPDSEAARASMNFKFESPGPRTRNNQPESNDDDVTSHSEAVLMVPVPR